MRTVTEGHLFIVAAPSGAGKTSLVRALVGRLSDLTCAVSYTTRLQREGEIDGQDYCFVDDATFDRMVDQDVFLEHAEVFGHRYGTHRDHVLQLLDQGLDVVLEIDWQGAANIKQWRPSACGIYILPPSRQALLHRLEQRGQDQQDVIARRMQCLSDDMMHCGKLDYIVINEVFNQALEDLIHIVSTQRLKANKQMSRHSDLIMTLTQSH